MNFYVCYITCVSIYLKSVVRYNFVNFVTYHPDTVHLREERCEEPRLFFEVRRGSRTKTFVKHCHKVQFVAMAFSPDPLKHSNCHIEILTKYAVKHNAIHLGFCDRA